MEPNLMLQSATGLFVVAALGGLAMAGIRLLGKRNPPPWLALLHGLLAGAGITLLLYAALTTSIPRITAACSRSKYAFGSYRPSG